MEFQYETEIEFNEELCSVTITLDDVEYEHVAGSYYYNAASDMDYYGYTNLDFTVSSIEVTKPNGSTFYTNSKNVINELISEKMYGYVYDWLLDQVRK